MNPQMLEELLRDLDLIESGTLPDGDVVDVSTSLWAEGWVGRINRSLKTDGQPEPVAWRHPETKQIISDKKKAVWLKSKGGYRILAESYVEPLYDQPTADAATVKESLTHAAAPTDDIHSCSLFCDRPACVKAQRDEMRRKFGAASVREPQLGSSVRDFLLAEAKDDSSNARAQAFRQAAAFINIDLERKPAAPVREAVIGFEPPPLKALPWAASEYLDDGRFGVIDQCNRIIVGIRDGLTKEIVQVLASAPTSILELEKARQQLAQRDEALRRLREHGPCWGEESRQIQLAVFAWHDAGKTGDLPPLPSESGR